MADFEQNNANVEEDLFAGDVVKDEGIDLSAFIGNNAKAVNAEEEEKPDTNNAKPAMTALERELEKAKHSTKGMPITQQQYEDGLEKTEFRMANDTDERREAMEARVEEQDEMMKKRMAIVPLKQYEDSTEYTRMIEEISKVEFDANGKAYFKDLVDENGNPTQPKLIRLRTEDDPPYSKENDFMLLKKDGVFGSDAGSDDDDDDIINTERSEPEKVSDDTDKAVKVIIDKTGLGGVIDLTDEEREKLVEANEIRLTQVEVLDLASITTERPEDRSSFLDNIHNYEISGTKTTICFPASGFKADMQGLTYGEIGDISLSLDSTNTDQYYKRMSIVYNKMKNISCGPFESFEDFLKGFAFTDIPLAIYGLFVSTFPEVQTVQLRCGRRSCNETFPHTYSTRDIIKLKRSADTVLEKMSELTSADPSQYDEIRAKSAVKNSKLYKLPISGYIVEMGIASVNEFIYNFIPMINEDNFRAAFGTDPNQVYLNNVLLLTTVLSVRVPKGDGSNTYIMYEGYKDILDAIYQISPEEIKILAGISAKLQRQYQVVFSFGDVVCPHCQNVTRDMDITIDELVFQTYQRLLSTEVDLTNIQL